VKRFAKLDKNNKVIEIIIANNKTWCEKNLGGIWIEDLQAKAGLNYEYSATLKNFIPPKPYDSWLLDEDTCQWNAPVPMPTDGKYYSWNEELGDWEEVDE